ncbi:MAG: AAA family ATPase, partial [Terriglobia bacterium]
TTVAVNLGVQMARLAPQRVALLDFGRPLGEVSLLGDVRPRFSIRDALENLDRLDAHFMERLVDRHKSGLHVLAGAYRPDDWQSMPASELARLVSRTQNFYDHVLIDFGSVYTSEWKPVFEPAKDILLVAEAAVPALWPIERHLAALESMGVSSSRIHIVINRWHRQDDDALKSVEKMAKRPIFSRIPNDFRQASRANNMGVPLVEDRINGLASKYGEIARQLVGARPSQGE